MSMEITIREYDSKTDDPYIYSTWTKYAFYSPEKPIKTAKHVWFKQKIDEIKNLLATSHVKIACIKGSPYVIIGYIVLKDGEIRWLCVKKDYHNQGVEKLLEKSAREAESKSLSSKECLQGESQ